MHKATVVKYIHHHEARYYDFVSSVTSLRGIRHKHPHMQFGFSVRGERGPW